MTSPVLLYHKIDTPTPDVKVRGAFTRPDKFKKQLLYLRKRGWNFITASAMAAYFRDHRAFPSRTLALTFDDGWKDNYDHAFPALKELNIPATVYLVPDCIGRKTDAVVAAGEAPREHMSAAHVREMAAAGIEFGSHSMSHRLFDSLSAQEIEREAADSRRAIEELLQRPCETLAYPAGHFTAEARRIVRQAGYISAFTTIYGSDEEPDLFALNRTEILRRHSRPFQFGRRIRGIVTG